MLRVSLIAAAMLAAVAQADDDAKKDLEKMQGEWQVTAFEFSGQKIPKDETDKLSVSIKGDQLTPISKVATTIKLDPTTTPKQITLTEAAKTQYGVYEIDGDTLKLCLSNDELARPKAFASEKGSKTILLVMTRKK